MADENVLASGLDLPSMAPTIDPLQVDPTLTRNTLLDPLVKAQPEGPGIIDMTKSGVKAQGKFESNPKGMVIHHTGGGNKVEQVIDTFHKSGLGSQFVIDKEGKIYQLMPDGSTGAHIKNSWGPMGEGMGNHNMEGVEVIANNDKDVNDAQKQAAARLVAARSAMWGWDPKTNVFGHGEINPGHKMPDEGLTIANGVRNGTLQLPDYSSVVKPVQIQDGNVTPYAGLTTPLSSGPNQLSPQQARVNVPEHIAPLLNYWADYHGLDRDIFARMIRHESQFDHQRVGGTPAAKGGPEVGLGQLMPGTAAQLGVKDRTDINENLRGSAQYLRQMLDNPKVAGDYRKALMLYNSGPRGNFRNTEYADQVLGSPGGVQAGDYLGGGFRAGGQLASSLGAATAAMPGLTAASGMASAPTGRVPFDFTPQQQEQAFTPPPADPQAMSQIDRQSRLLQMLSIARAFSQGAKFTPVDYDPFKVSRQGEGASYSPNLHIGGSGVSLGQTGAQVPVPQMRQPVRGTKATQPYSST